MFHDRLRHGIAKALRVPWQLGVLVLDMDGLKPINDRHGHRAGDAALKEMASRIAAKVCQSDTAARLGGDEFAVVLSRVHNRDSALTASRRIPEHCDRTLEFEITLPSTSPRRRR